MAAAARPKAARVTIRLASTSRALAEDQAGRPASRAGGGTTTYAAFDEQTARVAWLIRSRGLELGDPVAVMLPNVPQFAVIYYGVLLAGRVVVPMNILLKSREVTFFTSRTPEPSCSSPGTRWPKRPKKARPGSSPLFDDPVGGARNAQPVAGVETVERGSGC